MRYFQYLMIPAAFLAGVFAVSSVQAQTAYMQPSLYSKTGYQPVAAGSYVSYSANGQGHTILANDASYYVKSQVVDPRQNVTYAAPIPYAEPVSYAQPIINAAVQIPNVPAVAVPMGQYETLSYQTQNSASAGRTFVQPDGSFVNADGMPVWYSGGEPRVVVVKDTSDLPGYGVQSTAPTGYDSQPFEAEQFPAVYAPVGSASHFLETAYPSEN
ncbi:hypothetical protein N9M21_09020 [Alphaproteobacteria bacterium]|nr:hypothetical protein [Alphaproteobacteria bacterium]